MTAHLPVEALYGARGRSLAPFAAGEAQAEPSSAVGAPLTGPCAADRAVLGRSRVTVPQQVRDGRRKAVAQTVGRRMVAKLLAGMGLREHRAAQCGWQLGSGRSFRQGPDGTAKITGTVQCANGRLCPVCGPRLAAVRAAEVGATCWRWMTGSEGRSAVFVSIAVSHRPTDRLGDVHDALAGAREVVMRSSDRRWRQFRQRHGIADVSWVLEHNHGANGPHPQVHAIFLLDRWWDADEVSRAEAWLVLAFRQALADRGWHGRLSIAHGIDVRPIDDPAGIGRYLTKWAIGAELAGEWHKTAKVDGSMPYTAIPWALAERGVSDPHGPKARADRETRRLVAAWQDYARLAIADGRHWYRGFHRTKELVPELAGATNGRERIAAALDVLPAELRWEEAEQVEADEDDDEGQAGGLDVDAEAWAGALAAWQRHRTRWAPLLRTAIGEWHGPPVPLELAVLWAIEDHGVEAAASAVAELAGADVADDDGLWTVRYDSTEAVDPR